MRQTFQRLTLSTLALLVGCGERAPTAPDEPAVPVEPEVIEARLPRLPPRAEHAPSLMDTDGPMDLALLNDVESCGDCHEDALAQHRGGPHAHASFDNPWYRAVVDDLRQTVGFEESRHCGGCHDPLLLLSGAMDRPIEPGDPFTTAGVTCMVCHSITTATSDGNGSYVLTNADPLLPDPNDEEEVAAHRARMAPEVLRSPALCASCHRGFLHEGSGTATFFPGIDEPGAWRGSAWGGQHAARIDGAAEARDCRGCHMTVEPAPTDFAGGEDRVIASHRFAGGHSALASALGDPDQLRRVVARMETAASIDVVAIDDDGPLDGPVNGELSLDVVVRNIGTGHRFPGGIRDARAHHVRITVTDASGRVVLEEGGEESERTLALRTEVVDETGTIETAHRTRVFRALAADHTIAARDAAVVRYRIDPVARLPLTVEVALVARRHRPGLRALACEASRSERGRAFMAASVRPIDGCAEEPEIVLAHGEHTIAEDGPLPSAPRLYVHALGLLHDISEHLDDARPSLELARASDDEALRAAVLVALGELEGREGRLEEALARADEAEALFGHHPAIDRVRGRAYAAVWRWGDAAAAYAAVTEAAPLDTEAWRDLARARGSIGEDRLALTATARGLMLQPRDEGLLRTQALALEALGDPRATEARAAHLWCRRPDVETSLRFSCDRDPLCASRRAPLPRH